MAASDFFSAQPQQQFMSCDQTCTCRSKHGRIDPRTGGVPARTEPAYLDTDGMSGSLDCSGWGWWACDRGFGLCFGGAAPTSKACLDLGVGLGVNFTEDLCALLVGASPGISTGAESSKSSANGGVNCQLSTACRCQLTAAN